MIIFQSGVPTEIGFPPNGMVGCPINMMISPPPIPTVSMIRSSKANTTGHHPTMDSRSTPLGIPA